ncbi:MAG: hypothetical protein NVS3B21_05230 [Acidimicrobiales bacterium]
MIVGAPVVLDDVTAHHGEASAALRHLEGQGRTAVVVLVDSVPVAVLGLVDQLRPRAMRTVEALTRVTGKAPLLLTGDNYLAAGRLGHEVGITDVRAGLLPADKATHVNALAREGDKVLVVGDGINDAPALAAAHIGVSMGRHGSDLTLQTADAVLVRDDLATLPAVIELSRQARRAVIQNLVLAGIAILGLVTWDLVGHLPLPLGVLGHEGGTVLIGLNGLRLLRVRAWVSSPVV